MKKWIFIILCCGIIISGCLEEITLKNQKLETKAIIIQGKLIKGTPSIAEVWVRRIGDFEGYEAETHLSGAKVFLVSDDGTSIQVTEELENKRYRAVIPENGPSFRVETGRSYHIEVSLLDGAQFVSEPEPMLPVAKIDQVNYKMIDLTIQKDDGSVNTEDYIQFMVSTPLQLNDMQERARLRWQLFAAYRLTDDNFNTCYNLEPLRTDQTFIYNGEAFQSERLDTFPLVNIQFDFRFAEGFYLTLVQESLSENAFTYWNQIKILAERNGNMFDPPAGKILTNIKNIKTPDAEVYGYFYVAPQDTLRRYIRPEEVGSPKKYCPLPPPTAPRMSPTLCDNCLIGSGSSLKKPTYWIE
ncbi:MAG: DUF4249 family protein [Saprospiraceae bacterium]|nr:DUF4249 family protein [Saprospiraceae bacterium]